jgi:hypothetical protein
MKKSGTNYVNPDGNLSNKDVIATGINGDCAVLKNGGLVSAVCDEPAFFVCENRYVNEIMSKFNKPKFVNFRPRVDEANITYSIYKRYFIVNDSKVFATNPVY